MKVAIFFGILDKDWILNNWAKDLHRQFICTILDKSIIDKSNIGKRRKY